jgi:hypothetical protein
VLTSAISEKTPDSVPSIAGLEIAISLALKEPPLQLEERLITPGLKQLGEG